MSSQGGSEAEETKPVDEEKETIGVTDQREKRTKYFTEKGREYDETILDEMFNRLTNLSASLINKVKSGASFTVVSSMYSVWMNNYEQYLEKHQLHIARLKYPDGQSYLEDFQKKDEVIQSFMKNMKDHLAAAQQEKISETRSLRESLKGSQSSRFSPDKQSVRSKSASQISHVSSKRMKEEETKVELLEKLKAHQRKKDIELAKMKLKLEEEELELSTGLAVANAKSQLLDKYESGERIDSKFLKAEVKEDKIEESKSHIVSQPPKISQPSVVLSQKPKKEPGIQPPDEGFVKVDKETEISNTPDTFKAKYKETEKVKPVEMSHPVAQQSGLEAVVQHLRKPVAEIKKFSGNPMEFRKFVRQFEAKVSSNTSSDEERMNYLEQFTIGEANKVVSGFSHLNGKCAFQAAMKQLEDRYGDKDVIANAFAKKALSWPSIKLGDSKALDEFALFLVECENAVGSVGAGSILEYSENIRKLMSKLPFNLHDRWRNIVLRSKNDNTLIRFSKFVQFVKDESKKLNDPLYGNEALKSSPKDNNFDKKGKLKNRLGGATGMLSSAGEVRGLESEVKTISDSKFKCQFCDSTSHSLMNCKSVIQLSMKDRCDFVRKRGLCFGCLKTGHRSSECGRRLTCSVCNKKHPTILHDESKSTSGQRHYTQGQSGSLLEQQNSVQVQAGSSSLCASQLDICGSTGAGDGDTTCAMSIIPVRVKVKDKPFSVVTYAFFDTGCNVSFCTEALMTKLGVSGIKMKLTLGTIGDPFTMNTYSVHGLQVCDLDMSNKIDLPRVYTKSNFQ